MIEVSAASRIHLSLTDMGYATPRAYGGVGFMIDRPRVQVRVHPSFGMEWKGFEILDSRGQRECRILGECLNARYDRGAEFELISAPLQHVGLGSKTALKLAILAGYSELHSLSMSREEQQRLSGRGGASGVGLHGFFEGGVIWDAGRPRDEVPSLAPSSSNYPTSLPLLMGRFLFPDDWMVGLCLPTEATVAGSAEATFFSRHCPVDPDSTLRTIAALLHGVLPALLSVDLNALRAAVATVNSTGFKALEVSQWGDRVRGFLDILQRRGYAAGLSSMGPLVFAIFDKNDRRKNVELECLCLEMSVVLLDITPAANGPALITRR